LPGNYGASTRKGNTIFLHILKWNGDAITLPGLPKKVTEGTLLTGGEMKFEQTETALRITVAPQYRQNSDTVVKLQLDGSAMGIAPIATEQSGS